jgi:hypothetical protein
MGDRLTSRSRCLDEVSTMPAALNYIWSSYVPTGMDAQLVDAEYQQGILQDVNALNASFRRIGTEWSAVSSSLKSLDMDLQERTENPI